MQWKTQKDLDVTLLTSTELPWTDYQKLLMTAGTLGHTCVSLHPCSLMFVLLLKRRKELVEEEEHLLPLEKSGEGWWFFWILSNWRDYINVFLLEMYTLICFHLCAQLCLSERWKIVDNIILRGFSLIMNKFEHNFPKSIFISICVNCLYSSCPFGELGVDLF